MYAIELVELIFTAMVAIVVFIQIIPALI